MRVCLTASTLLLITCGVQAQDNGAWIFNLLKNEGGCERQAPIFTVDVEREIRNVKAGASVGPILGRKAKDWSQTDADFAAKIFARCNAEITNYSSDEQIGSEEIAVQENKYASQLREIVVMSRRDPAKRYGERFSTPDFCPPDWYGRGRDAKPDGNDACKNQLADAQARKELEKADQDLAIAERLKRQADEQAEALRSAKDEAAKALQARKEAEQRLAGLQLQRSFTDSSRAEAEAESRRRNSEAFSTVNPRGSCKVSFGRFERAKSGMSYDQVRRIFGCDGTEGSQNQFGNLKTVMYNWSGGLLSSVQVIFQNNKLVSKSQAGLE